MGKAEETREKIINTVIKISADEGISAVTTQSVAKHCNIAEGTIFYHFGNFKELLIETFMFIDGKKAATLSRLNPDFPPDADLRNEYRTVWQFYFDFWLERPLEAKFYSEFFHSSLYDYKVHTVKDESYLVFKKLVECQKLLDEAYQKIGYLNIWQYIINTTIDFAIKMSDGRLNKTDEVKIYIFELIHERLFKASDANNQDEQLNATE